VRIEELQRQDSPSLPAVVIHRAIMVADHVLIRTQPNVSTASLRSLCARHHLQLRKTLASPGHYLLSSSDPDTLPALIANLSAETNIIRYAEPDHILHTTETLPNDPNFANLWGLHNTGQSGGTLDADIDAPEAWDISTGTPTIVVGIIDTGADLTHPDLVSNIWVNPLETLNGLDDDGNGYIDDIHGWDFVANDNDPSDANSHGTHVAGTIAASGNNFQGVVGVTWRCSVMPLRFLDAGGNGSTSDALDALHYASTMRRHGINIRATNNSWGGGGDQALSDAIRESGQAGLLFIAAAGNSAGNNDVNPFLPASYPWDNIIAVASTDRRDNLSSFSCYGATSVDLAAPGSEIYSTIPGGYGLKSGTSMATPHVAGVAALLWSEWPDADWTDIRNAILNGTDPIPSLTGRTVTGGRLNAHKALLKLFHIAHTPQQDTFNTGGPYPITASIAPLALVDTNQLWLFWNTDHSTNFTATPLTPDATNRFAGTIPVQPEGTTVAYWIKAVSSAGDIVTHPTNAPATLHHFTIMPSMDFTVSGAPGPHGPVTPDYGSHPFPSNMLIAATASPYSTPSNNARWACLGWTGSGSTPAAGNSNSTTFTLSQTSSIEWLWSREYALTQTSSIPGIPTATTWWPANTNGTTLTATDTLLIGGTNYVFAHWLLDETRQPDPSLPAVNPVTGISMDRPHHAIAFYLPENLDADGDGMNDWWEYRFFGSTNATPDADADGDGFLNLAEFRDRTSPRQPAAFPAPPVIQHTPVPDPQNHPAPFPLSAIVTDNFTVAQVTFEWSKSGGPLHSALLLPGESVGLYSTELPAPGTNGDVYTYWIIARDPLGLTSTNGPNIIHINYPLLRLTPSFLTAITPPHSTTNLPLFLTNTGNTNLLAAVALLPAGYSNTFDATVTDWTSSGAGNLWTLTTNRAFSAPSAWYAGAPASRLYTSSMHACLDTPPLYLAPSSQMTFRHWIKCELDTQYGRYGWKPGHAWDGGIVEISTNGGISFAQIAPTGGYQYAISGWSESPWPEGTPCFAGVGGWNQATFDLAPFAGRLAIIRFHFGSDSNTEEEGWYLDDLVITPAPAIEPWLSCDPTNIAVTPSSTATVNVSFASGNIPTGDREAALLITCNDPTTPLTLVPQQMLVRSAPVLSLLGPARPSTNGDGGVTLSNTVYDGDGDSCSLELAWTTNGATWISARIRSTVAAAGTPSVNNTSTPQIVSITTMTNTLTFTNLLTTAWDSSASGNRLGYSTTTRLRARLWDGLLWSLWTTSQTFTVDNIPPPAPSQFTNLTHIVNTWSTNPAMTLEWRRVSDTGVGLDGYCLALSNNVPGSSYNGFTTFTSGHTPPMHDGSNWWASLRARDRYGNFSPAQILGPFRIDTTPPSSTGAVISLALDPNGAYLIGTSSVTGSWTGFADPGSGIARYICALTNLSPSTNGQCTLTPSATLTGLQLDATNVFSVWAVDNLGLVGTAASVSFLALNPNGDWDADGMLNAAENTAGTDPAKPGSRFLLALQSAGPSGTFVLRWPSVTNRLYTLAHADTLLASGTNWTTMTNWTKVPGVEGTMICTDQVENIPARFYRIIVEKP
jgi:subtilisin family serine protease